MSCLSHTAQKCPRLVKIKGKEKAVSAFSAIFVRRKPGITNDLLLTSILKDRGEFILLFTMITDYDCTHTLQCVQGYNRGEFCLRQSRGSEGPGQTEYGRFVTKSFRYIIKSIRCKVVR